MPWRAGLLLLKWLPQTAPPSPAPGRACPQPYSGAVSAPELSSSTTVDRPTLMPLMALPNTMPGRAGWRGGGHMELHAHNRCAFNAGATVLQVVNCGWWAGVQSCQSTQQCYCSCFVLL